MDAVAALDGISRFLPLFNNKGVCHSFTLCRGLIADKNGGNLGNESRERCVEYRDKSCSGYWATSIGRSNTSPLRHATAQRVPSYNDNYSSATILSECCLRGKDEAVNTRRSSHRGGKFS